MNPKQFGATIKALRKARRLTQEEVCANVDFALTKATLSAIESGQTQFPKLGTIDLITDGLGLPFDALYDDYLQMTDDRQSLLSMAQQCGDGGQMRLARKALGKWVRILKQSGGRLRKNQWLQLLALLIRWDLLESEREQALSRKIRFLTVYFRESQPEELFQWLEEMYVTMRKRGRGELFLMLGEAVMEQTVLEPHRQFRLGCLLAKAHEELKNFEKAYFYGMNAFACKCTVPDLEWAALCLQLGRLHMRFQRYGDAIALLQQAETYLPTADPRALESRMLIARAWGKQQVYAKAAACWDRLLQEIREDHPMRLFSLSCYAFLELTQGDRMKGKRMHQHVMNEIGRQRADNTDTGRLLRLLHRRNAVLLDSEQASWQELFELAIQLAAEGAQDESQETMLLAHQYMHREFKSGMKNAEMLQ